MSMKRREFLKTGIAHASVLLSGFAGLSLVMRGYGRSTAVAAETVAEMEKPMPEAEVKTGANGLYVQPWFEDGFLDLGEELEAASLDDKQLVLLYEQTGCPYCKELHRVNLARAEIASYMQQNYRVVQIDIRGSREVTDFTGKSLSEKAFAHQAQIHFTPTLSFFPRKASKVLGKKGKEAEAFRLTGYWKPFHFETVLRFVRDGAYKQENLQSYLGARLEALKKEGRTQPVWE